MLGRAAAGRGRQPRAGTATRRTSPGSGRRSRAARRRRGCARSSHSFKTRAPGDRQAEAMTEAETPDTRTPPHWQTMSFRDADPMVEWLPRDRLHRARDVPARPTRVGMHAEWLWPGGGGIMFGPRAIRRPAPRAGQGRGSTWSPTIRGRGLRRGAIAAGATVQRPRVVDQDYGGRGGSVARPGGQPLVLRVLPAVLKKEEEEKKKKDRSLVGEPRREGSVVWLPAPRARTSRRWRRSVDNPGSASALRRLETMHAPGGTGHTRSELPAATQPSLNPRV